MKLENVKDVQDKDMKAETEHIQSKEINTMKEADDIFDKIFHAVETKKEYDSPASSDISFGSSASSS